jgi:Kef-type K+ transport system membrane component KefB
MSAESLAVRVLLAIAVILPLAHVCAAAVRRLGQPPVIGEILAGIALGPSLLGRLPGGLDHRLFPAQVIPALTVVSQLALVLFLFAVGYELDLGILRSRSRAVPVIAAATSVVPMLLGAGSAVVLAGWYQALGASTGRGAFILFLAVVFGITAVPVLARVVEECQLSGTLPGVMSLAAAGVIDGIGWLVLATALFEATAGKSRSWAATAALFACYLIVMVAVVRPILLVWSRRRPSSFVSMWPVVAAVVLASAWATGELGLHVIFGALLCGLLMPRRPSGDPFPELIEPARRFGRFLLPVFFALSGLSMDVGAVGWLGMALVAVACLIATAGKLGAGTLAARASRLSWHESAVIGTLLNTRGLTELIALNVGLSAGIIEGRLYTVFVLMAVITTAATGPLLRVLARRQPGTGQLGDGADVTITPATATGPGGPAGRPSHDPLSL